MQFLKSVEVQIRKIRNRLTPYIYKGDAVFCPVCEYSFSKFLPAGTGHRHRPNAVCPYCRSRERDRLNWLFLKSRPHLLKLPNMHFLHIAPEPCFTEYLKQNVGDGYITADLMRKDVMVKMDVMDIQYPDAFFDAIYCSHVLQDVPDDTRALNEFFRVLKPGGWAVLNVPLFANKTRGSTIAGNVRPSWDKRPDEHVREYGIDYAHQLASHGFTVEVWNAEKLVPDASERRRLAIDGPRVGYIHFVSKP